MEVKHGKHEFPYGKLSSNIGLYRREVAYMVWKRGRGGKEVKAVSHRSLRSPLSPAEHLTLCAEKETSTQRGERSSSEMHTLFKSMGSVHPSGWHCPEVNSHRAYCLRTAETPTWALPSSFQNALRTLSQNYSLQTSLTILNIEFQVKA